MLMPEEKRIKLAEINTSPYVALATMLICKGRKSSGNQFRHQFETLGILIDYGYIDSVLHKAALTHDILEDLDFDKNLLINADCDGSQVYKVVLEVTKTETEKKTDFLRRIYEHGSERAKLLKTSDRISNMKDLGLGLTDRSFIERYCDETEQFVLPIAASIDFDMYTELLDHIKSRRKL
jgi:GTP pyrophosphokinase